MNAPPPRLENLLATQEDWDRKQTDLMIKVCDTLIKLFYYLETASYYTAGAAVFAEDNPDFFAPNGRGGNIAELLDGGIKTIMRSTMQKFNIGAELGGALDNDVIEEQVGQMRSRWTSDLKRQLVDDIATHYRKNNLLMPEDEECAYPFLIKLFADKRDKYFGRYNEEPNGDIVMN